MQVAHRHKLRWGVLEGMGVTGGEEQRGECWDNCYSIISKVYFKNKIKRFCLNFYTSQTIFLVCSLKKQVENCLTDLSLFLIKAFCRKIFIWEESNHLIQKNVELC